MPNKVHPQAGGRPGFWQVPDQLNRQGDVVARGSHLNFHEFERLRTQGLTAPDHRRWTGRGERENVPQFQYATQPSR
ncbi:hypothetical protein LMG29542_06764 [Paraburkholderia humisilvae]|uniref:Uncharacterized protein n=1 Tax=Paraburkholderia humisilvae TaxID=627669 RepID=A0A6J5F3W9_9BURK|nr:hypothetical protein LMG29542_06764 [Paraburkholderia humisilvae]